MALTRAQLLMGNQSQGDVLTGQPQGVRPGGAGIAIALDGVISVDSQTIIGVMKMGQTPVTAAAAYNGYTWPTTAGLPGQQLESDGAGVLSWADSDGIDWTQKGQLIAATGPFPAPDTLVNVGSTRSFLVSDPGTTSGLAYTDSINTSVKIPAGTDGQKPAFPVAGDFRINTDTEKLEFYTGSGWEEVASGNPQPGGETFVKQSIPTPGTETGNALIPVGTSAERQTAPASIAGSVRYNSDFDQLEVFDGLTWLQIPAGNTDFVKQTRPAAGKTASAVIPPGATGQEETAGLAGGFMRYNTTNNLLEFYNGTSWELVSPSGGGVHSFVQAGTPTAFNPGDLWYDTNLQRESVWDGVAWVQPGVTQTSPTGAALIPTGVQGLRPAPVAGQFRLNTTTGKLEFYSGTAWEQVASGDPTPGPSANTYVEQTIPITGTASAVIPAGDTANRQTNPAPAEGYLRFNQDPDVPMGTQGTMEFWDGTAWVTLAATPAPGGFVPQTSPTGAAVTPSGNTLARPASPLGGYFRYNTDQNYLEFYNAATTTWELLAPAAGGVHSFVQAGTPTAFNLGDIWYDTALQRESVWDGATWVQPGVSQTGPNGAALIPSGTTAQEPPAASAVGAIRYNTSVPEVQYSDGTSWLPIGAPRATLAEAQSGTIINKYNSPENTVPKDAAGMTGSAFIPAGNTAARPAAGLYTGQLRYNTQIPQLEYSDGVNWISPGFPSGTRMPFAQAAAPTGWTQDTSAAVNDSAIRLVTGAGGGTGGALNFSTVFVASYPISGTVTFTAGSVSGTTLSTAQLASHNHPLTGGSGLYLAPTYSGASFGIYTNFPINNVNAGPGSGATTSYTGSNATHTHSLAGASSPATLNGAFNIKYVDMIICTKN